jgi:SAM-dependent methyltransferase
MSEHYTDREWEKWGARDPYFGVITSEEFRRDRMTDEGRQRFFESGRSHVQYVMSVCRQRIEPNFAPGRVLDFGCGVGRVSLPFAEMAQSVVGVDISQAMLQEAEKNRAERALRNVVFVKSDDDLANVVGTFDLIHSFIVFQHMEVNRGRRVFGKLIERLAPGGILAAHFTYGKMQYADTFGVPPVGSVTSPPELPGREDTGDPVMLMNPYNVNELLFTMQTAGVRGFHTDFTDHGGELGVLLYFQKS